MPCFWSEPKSTRTSSAILSDASCSMWMSEWNEVMTQPSSARAGVAAMAVSQSAANVARAARTARLRMSQLAGSDLRCRPELRRPCGRICVVASCAPRLRINGCARCGARRRLASAPPGSPNLSVGPHVAARILPSPMTEIRHDIRNVAIIAHVDHGKTTLVDALLKQSHTFRENQEVGTLIMDTSDLEREKGITILAKNTSIRHGDVTINIIDTPGHADFGGEVERVVNMADGCLLLVDAAEGPMPQTRFVLRKAFEAGLRIIIVINRVDRANADPYGALEKVHDLFLELAEDADQLVAPVVYAIAKQGRAGSSPETLAPDLEPLFGTIIERIPGPVVEPGAFQMLVANRAYDDYTGTIAIGRITRGSIAPADNVAVLDASGAARPAKVAQVLMFRGLERVAVERATAGDIAMLTGLEVDAIANTVTHPDSPEPLPRIEIDEPTVRMTFGINTSPLAGREGVFSTTRHLRARLLK